MPDVRGTTVPPRGTEARLAYELKRASKCMDCEQCRGNGVRDDGHSCDDCEGTGCSGWPFCDVNHPEEDSDG